MGGEEKRIDARSCGGMKEKKDEGDLMAEKDSNMRCRGKSEGFGQY